MRLKSCTVLGAFVALLVRQPAWAGAFLLADRDYAAPFYLGWDYPQTAQAAIDEVVATVRAKSGVTLKPFALQTNPRAGYLFASVQPWCAEDAYFAKIDHGVLEIHATNEKSLAAALREFNAKCLKPAQGPRLAFDEVSLAYGPQPVDVREAEIARVRALREGAHDWENELVNSRNRCAARTDNLPEGYAIKLNGLWRHHWVATPARRPQGFERPDFDDSAWRKIPVPSCIETLGLNTPWYVDDYYFHPHVPPKVGCAWNPVSSYRTTFTVPNGWQGRKVYLRFCGVATAYYLWVNGRKIGYSEDSHLPFEFDVTEVLHDGENTLAVEVYQFSDGEYLENNDRFRLTGIFRDVVLWSKPTDGVGDWHWETDFNADMSEATLRVVSDAEVTCELIGPDGRSLAKFARELKVERPQLWSDENPILYTLKVRRSGDERTCRVGFRKIAIAADGAITLNGRAIKLKGINRSDFSAETGWTLTDAEIENDVRMIKQANFNLIRTSHNPNASKLYAACDEMGVLVQAEGNVESHGMGYGTNSLANPLSWSVAYVERNVNQVKVLRNHPSIVMWSLGNEAGPGPNVMFARDAVRALDDSRLVMYRNDDGKFDVDGACYMGAARVEACARERKTFFHSEYAHAMGNTFGDFHTFWDEDGKGYWFHPCLTGGAVWDWADQALWKKSDRKDADGRPFRFLAYGGDWDDVPNQGNDCANGILLADRKWNPALTEIKHAQRPIAVKKRDAKVEVWNRAAFTSTDDYAAEWTLVENGVPVASGAWDLPTIEPMTKKLVDVPQTGYALMAGKEYFINFTFKTQRATAWAKEGWVVADDQVAVGVPVGFATRVTGGSAVGTVDVAEDADGIALKAHDTEVVFCRDSGLISRLTMGGKVILAGEFAGPRLTCVKAFTDSDKWMNAPFMRSGLSQLHYNPTSFKITRQTGAVSLTVELAVDSPRDRGFAHTMTWTLYGDGTLKLENETAPWGEMPTLPRFGLSLRLNDEFENLTWYGRGPDENYVDRNQGTFIGRYASTVTEQFVPYTRPQDNGYKTDVREVSFTGADGRGVTIAADRPLFLQALRYTWDDLDGARHRNKERKRWVPLVPRKEVCVNLDILQTGLGMSSCGPRSLTQIRIGKERWTMVFRSCVPSTKQARQ